MILPDQHLIEKITDPLLVDQMLEAKAGTSPLYPGIFLAYNYSNNHQGKFGIITKYNNQTQQFALVDNWIG